jgi:hypothetical protein
VRGFLKKSAGELIRRFKTFEPQLWCVRLDFSLYENLDYRDDEAVNNKEQLFEKKRRNFQSQSCFAHASSALGALRSKRISYRSTNLLDHSSTPAPSFGECVVIEASIVGPQFLFALLCVRLCLF